MKYPASILLLAAIALIILIDAYASNDYSVEITRKAANLYKVERTNLYIKTRYCYEYSYNQKVILKYTGGSGFSKGKLLFKNGSSYDIQDIYSAESVRSIAFGLSPNGELMEISEILTPTKLR